MAFVGFSCLCIGFDRFGISYGYLTAEELPALPSLFAGRDGFGGNGAFWCAWREAWINTPDTWGGGNGSDFSCWSWANGYSPFSITQFLGWAGGKVGRRKARSYWEKGSRGFGRRGKTVCLGL